MEKYKIVILSLFCLPLSLTARSYLRPKNPEIPQLIAKWDGGTQEYVLNNSHIEEYPLFVVYNEKHFNEHLLPEEDIVYRYDQNKKVSGTVLNSLIEQLVEEIKACKKKFTHFEMLQNKDFNHKKAAGLIVLRFKEYPFIVKLFIETPESFVNPWCKGTQPVWFFYMGGGVNRHITGLTRLKNMEYIREKLKQNEKWQGFVDIPRKWFWVPQQQAWVILIGNNLGGKKQITTRIPSIYAIIADEIISAEKGTEFDHNKRKIALELCNDLDLYIDPHIDNFLVEQGSNKLLIIDTEHFPTLVGFKEKRSFKTYLHWYLGLAYKAAHDIFFRIKSERKQAQYKRSALSIF